MPRAVTIVLTLTFALTAAASHASTGASADPGSRGAQKTSLVPRLTLDVAYGQPIQTPPQGGLSEEERPHKSLGAVVPLAFLVGFGSAHFYIGAKWRGLRYLAFDLVALAIDATLLVFAYKDYMDLAATWVISGVIFAGNRIYQTVDAAQTLSLYNKGYDVRDAMAPGRTPTEVALNPNDGGMPRGRLKTVAVF